MYYIQGQIVTDSPRVVSAQWENSKFIMAMVTGSESIMKRIQACRLYLRDVTLTDLARGDGTIIKQNILCRAPSASQLEWSVQHKP